MPQIAIRPYRRQDRSAVRLICIEAGWRGRPAREFLDDPDLWADLWTAYYLLREPGNCWVACDPAGRVVGYLAGAADGLGAQRFAATRVIPAIAARALFTGQWLRPMNRKFFARTIRAARRGQLAIPRHVLRDCPGHFHFNLLADCRGQGVGRRLYALFEQRMRDLGVPGLHSQVLAANELVIDFHRRQGYCLVERRRVPSLDGYLEPGLVELVLHVKAL